MTASSRMTRFAVSKLTIVSRCPSPNWPSAAVERHTMVHDKARIRARSTAVSETSMPTTLSAHCDNSAAPYPVPQAASRTTTPHTMSEANRTEQRADAPCGLLSHGSLEQSEKPSRLDRLAHRDPRSRGRPSRLTADAGPHRSLLTPVESPRPFNPETRQWTIGASWHGATGLLPRRQLSGFLTSGRTTLSG